MGIIVRRPSLEEFLRSGGRRLLYGRRKTGKTFYARLVLPEYKYFIVRRGGLFMDPETGEEFGLGAFLRMCGERVIVDEFHRADARFFDALQAGSCGGDIVLVTSTLHFYRRFVEGPEAPLKGLFSLRRVDLLSPLELLAADWGLGGRELVERLVFWQEPVLVGKSLEECVVSGSVFARSLVGEVLDEEDASYSRRFDAILEAVAGGATRLSEIASYLHSKGLVEKASTSHITKYVDAMVKMGLLERVEIWGRERGSFYRHASPLTDIVYYLDARYGLRDYPAPWGFVERVVRERMPLLVERFVERFMAEYFGLKPVKVLDPEVDVALVSFKKIEVAAEVKWKHGLTPSEVRRAEERLSRLHAPRRILVAPEAVSAGSGLEVWSVEDLVQMARERARGSA